MRLLQLAVAAAVLTPGVPLASPVQEIEVEIASTAEGIVLSGTLAVPSGDRPRPAVLMITGNGPHTRDQIISGSPMFAQIANHLADRGLVVLRTDARGFGASTGPADWEQTTTADRLEDNRAILEYLRARPEVRADRIAVLGHSEGAMIAAALAASDGEREPVALAILLAPPALPGCEVFARQLSDSLLRRGSSPEVAEAVRQQLLRFTDHVNRGGRNDEAFQTIALDFLIAHGVPAAEADPELARGLLSGYLDAPWYLDFFARDPVPDLENVQGAVVAVLAAEDENVPPSRHAAPLTAALGRSRTSDFAVIVLPDQDHFFLEFEGRRLDRHESGRMHVASELLDALDAELSRRGWWQD